MGRKTFKLREPEYYLNKGNSKTSSYLKTQLSIGIRKEYEKEITKFALKCGAKYKGHFRFKE